jgi:hypothetical protein
VLNLNVVGNGRPTGRDGHSVSTPPGIHAQTSGRTRAAPGTSARNRAESLLLLSGMVALLGRGWILLGLESLVWAPVAGVLSLTFRQRVSPGLVLRIYRASSLYPAEVPAVMQSWLGARGASASTGAVLRPQPDAQRFRRGAEPGSSEKIARQLSELEAVERVLAR